MESGKGQAEKQEKRDGFDNIPKYNVSIISGGTADGGKEHEGYAAGESHLHHGKPVCRFLRSWCRCSASASVQLNKLGVHSTKSPAGAVQSAQWRELDLSSSRATAESPAVMRCARRLSHLWCSSLSGGTADGEKDMRAPRPHTPRQVKITCTPANWFAVFKSFIGISKLWISEKIKFFSICHLHFSIFIVILIL